MRKIYVWPLVLAFALAGCPSKSPAPPPPVVEEVSAPAEKDNGAVIPKETPPPPASETEISKDGEESAWKKEYADSLEAAVKWLLDNQHEDGRWGHFLPSRPGDIYIGELNSLQAFGVASTALCCMGLLKQPSTREIDAALKKGFEYLVESDEARRVNGTTFYNFWTQAYMLQAFSRGLTDDRLKDLHEGMKKRGKTELRALLALQNLNGGFGYYDFYYKTRHPSGRLATSFGTAAVLVALKEAEAAGFEIPEKNVEIALVFLERLRFPNGAFAYSTTGEYYPQSATAQMRGSIGRNQSGNDALFVWDRLEAEDVKMGMDHFFKEHAFIEIGRCRQYPHEAWYGTAPYYYYFGHYYASRALYHIPEPDRKDYAGKLAGLVVKTQFDDGSFWDFPLYGYARAYGTGFGTLIMSNCRDLLE